MLPEAEWSADDPNSGTALVRQGREYSQEANGLASNQGSLDLQTYRLLIRTAANTLEGWMGYLYLWNQSKQVRLLPGDLKDKEVNYQQQRILQSIVQHLENNVASKKDESVMTQIANGSANEPVIDPAEAPEPAPRRRARPTISGMPTPLQIVAQWEVDMRELNDAEKEMVRHLAQLVLWPSPSPAT